MIGTRVLTLDGGSFEVREETPRLWVAHEMGSYGVRHKWRFPKKGGSAREARNERNWTKPVFLTEEARQEALRKDSEAKWAGRNQYRLSRAVEAWRGDVAVLRQIAALVGYKGE